MLRNFGLVQQNLIDDGTLSISFLVNNGLVVSLFFLTQLHNSFAELQYPLIK